MPMKITRENYTGYVNTKELAERTGFTKRFWENRRITGDTPPYFELGHRAIRYKWADVEKWMNERLKRNTSE